MSWMNPQTDDEMIEYMVECTMATVEEMIYKKKLPKWEYELS